MNKSIVVMIGFVLLPYFLFAQPSSYKYADFSKVDSFATTIKYKGDLTELTQNLTGSYPSQLTKTRAIFKWITDNIQYDYRFYNKYALKSKEPKTFICKENEDCEAKRLVWEMKYIDKTLRKKKAVCQGYAMLFKKMCDIAGLEAHILPGYVRTEPYQIGSSGNLDHAWNVVKIDSTYFLLDATWAAGGCSKNEETGELIRYYKNFKDYYWLTPPKDFARNHFPKDGKWSLVQNLTKQGFSENPYYKPSEIPYLKLNSPTNGFINTKQGDTIHFKFNYTKPIKLLQLNTNIFRNPDIWMEEGEGRKKKKKLDTFALKKQRYITYKQTGTLFEFDYVVPDNSLWYFDVLFDRQRVLRFKVKAG